jgi:hypothetical protein
MADKPTQIPTTGKEMADTLRGWVMVALTLIFVILYAAALTGWLKPLADEKMVTRLEPVIFVIIGYYFGRLPAQQNEKTLKDEINRQTQKSDAAQHAKEQVQQAREMLEERAKNARLVLAVSSPVSAAPGRASSLGAERAVQPSGEDALLRRSITTALNILNS